LSEDSIDALFNGYAKYTNLSACNWMFEHKTPAQIQQRIIKHHDQKTVDAIKANPYLLLGFGMSFSDVDVVAAKLVKIIDADRSR
jgi:exodeoxyribonuclease V alpha subunit